MGPGSFALCGRAERVKLSEENLPVVHLPFQACCRSDEVEWERAYAAPVPKFDPNPIKAVVSIYLMLSRDSIWIPWGIILVSRDTIFLPPPL